MLDPIVITLLSHRVHRQNTKQQNKKASVSAWNHGNSHIAVIFYKKKTCIQNLSNWSLEGIDIIEINETKKKPTAETQLLHEGSKQKRLRSYQSQSISVPIRTGSLQRTGSVGENEKQKALSGEREGRHSVYRENRKILQIHRVN